MKAIIVYCWILLVANMEAYGGGIDKRGEKGRLSDTDSVRLKGYVAAAFKCPLFSDKRQRLLDSALMIAPGYAWLWQQKGMALCKQRKYEVGMAYLDSAVKYDPENHWLEYRAFMKCIFQKSYREALEDFKKVRAVNGNTGVMDHPYDFYMGLCYLQLDRLDSAEDLFRRCIEDKRRTQGEAGVHYLHLFYMGAVYYARDDYKEALGWFEKCLKMYPNFTDGNYYKAVCLQRLGDHEGADKAIVEADKDLKDGYGITEDNAIYEAYPYQVDKCFLVGFRDWVVTEGEKDGK